MIVEREKRENGSGPSSAEKALRGELSGSQAELAQRRLKGFKEALRKKKSAHRIPGREEKNLRTLDRSVLREKRGARGAH